MVPCAGQCPLRVGRLEEALEVTVGTVLAPCSSATGTNTVPTVWLPILMGASVRMPSLFKSTRGTFWANPLGGMDNSMRPGTGFRPLGRIDPRVTVRPS